MSKLEIGRCKPELTGIDDTYWENRRKMAENAGVYLSGVLEIEQLGNTEEIRRSLLAIDGYASIVPNATEKIGDAIEVAARVHGRID